MYEAAPQHTESDEKVCYIAALKKKTDLKEQFWV